MKDLIQINDLIEDDPELQGIGRWTEKEDRKLKKLVEKYGEKNWKKISESMKKRSVI